ncbi:MAG: UvrY/SirA/GacA family response regulator transcription factor [Vicingaceae bacterium]
MIDILIVDNNDLSVEGLKSILQSRVGNRVVGNVKNIDELNLIAQRFTPDIIIIDFNNENLGLNSIQKIRSLFPNSKILAITDQLSKAVIIKALQTGVNSYLLKDCQQPEILQAIDETYKGKQFYCGEVINILSNSKDNPCEGIMLTSREVEIIKLIANGLTNKEIADKLCLSTHTVNTHRKNIMQKLGIKNTAGIVIYAVKENIIET